jgi:hypothetical protein
MNTEVTSITPSGLVRRFSKAFVTQRALDEDRTISRMIELGQMDKVSGAIHICITEEAPTIIQNTKGEPIKRIYYAIYECCDECRKGKVHMSAIRTQFQKMFVFADASGELPAQWNQSGERVQEHNNVVEEVKAVSTDDTGGTAEEVVAMIEDILKPVGGILLYTKQLFVGTTRYILQTQYGGARCPLVIVSTKRTPVSESTVSYYAGQRMPSEAFLKLKIFHKEMMTHIETIQKNGENAKKILQQVFVDGEKNAEQTRSAIVSL